MKNKLFAISMYVMLTTHQPVASQNDKFTLAEQQIIRVETPGLFKNGNKIEIDFLDLSNTDWCFPLPVGKIQEDMQDKNRMGLYIKTTPGDAVKAALDGVVRLSRTTSLGKTIVIRHINGLETLYANNAQNLVKVGEQVKAGQTIAIVGTKENDTYCYFEFMLNGGAVNPQLIMNLKTHKPHKTVLLCEKKDKKIGFSSLKRDHAGRERTTSTSLVDLNRELTTRECKEIAIATPGLFSKSNRFTLNLSEIKDWSHPLPGSKVISPYGGKRKNHSGTDLKTRANDEIKAVFGGVVRFSGMYHAYGNFIVIRHANGLETCYSHNSKNLVKSGQYVTAGQTIALTGRTGRATTEHCHFEVRVNGRTFNSGILFDHKNHALRECTLLFTQKKNGGVDVKSLPAGDEKRL